MVAPNYQVPVHYRDDLEKELKRLLDLGVIEPATDSAWNNPLITIVKIAANGERKT